MGLAGRISAETGGRGGCPRVWGCLGAADREVTLLLLCSLSRGIRRCDECHPAAARSALQSHSDGSQSDEEEEEVRDERRFPSGSSLQPPNAGGTPAQSWERSAGSQGDAELWHPLSQSSSPVTRALSGATLLHPQDLPPMVTKRRVPLAMSAAQDCCASPVHEQNGT